MQFANPPFQPLTPNFRSNLSLLQYLLCVKFLIADSLPLVTMHLGLWDPHAPPEPPQSQEGLVTLALRWLFRIRAPSAPLSSDEVMTLRTRSCSSSRLATVSWQDLHVQALPSRPCDRLRLVTAARLCVSTTRSTPRCGRAERVRWQWSVCQGCRVQVGQLLYIWQLPALRSRDPYPSSRMGLPRPDIRATRSLCVLFI